MSPFDEDVRLAAYYSWKRKGERSGFDQEDWFNSESDISIKANYNPVVSCPMGTGETIFIGKRESRRCRYCGLSSPEATFRKVAHALPESIGNKVLIALDECDRCNEFFSRALEDHLSKFIHPIRTSSAITGKKGVPSYKTSDKRSRIDYHSSERRFSVMERGSPRILTDDERAKTLTLSLETQPYIPIAVFKCLTKMALAIMPQDELRHFGRAIRWILDPDHGADISPHRTLGCYLYHSQRPFPQAWTEILRRNESYAPMPYMLFLVGSANLLMQAFLPFCERDFHHSGRSVVVPKFDLTAIPGFEATTCLTFPLSSPQPRTTTMTVNFTYEASMPIDAEGNPI